MPIAESGSCEPAAALDAAVEAAPSGSIRQLDDAEAALYCREVLHVARAIEAAFSPIKLNYDVLGNSVPHLHTHLVHTDDPRPGWPFPFPDPDPPPMPEDRLDTDLAALRRALEADLR